MVLSCIDQVYVLTLQENPRLPDLKKQYDVLCPGRYRLFPVPGQVKQSNDGSTDCSLWSVMNHNHMDATAHDITKNHLAMIRDAYDHQFSRVLFVEDDAYFLPWDSKKKERVERWLTDPASRWDICFLGYCLWPLLCSVLTTRDIVHVFTPLATHAYVMNRGGMEKLLEFTKHQQHRQWHFDKLVCKVPSFQKKAVFPMVAFQSKDPALYTKAMDHLGLNVSFGLMCRILEYVSVLLPILICLLVVGWITNRIMR